MQVEERPPTLSHRNNHDDRQTIAQVSSTQDENKDEARDIKAMIKWVVTIC
jgi:hypothetical protein